MLPDEANILKQKKRAEQIKRYLELVDAVQPESDYDKLNRAKNINRVKFPQGCVFLASCTANDIEEVKHYLKVGVNINTTNIDGLTALHQACIDDNFTMVKFLVENNADLNPQDNEGWTPLHAAVSVGNIEVVKFLVTKGAKLNVCNNDGDLPVDLCDVNNVQMKNYLDDEMKRQNIDPDYERTREELIMYEDAKELNFRDKIHPKTLATPLHVSAAKGYTRVMKLLIQSGANVNAVDKDGWTPLHAAAHWEQEESCRILAENGGSFEARNYSGQTPFDVCDDDMINKLKSIQNKIKQQAKDKSAIELTAINNTNSLNSSNVKTDQRANRRSSIVRVSAETKSSISDREKKQEKSLLSPNSQVTQNGSDNSDNEKVNENDDSKNQKSIKKSDPVQFTSDKENINTNSYDSSNTSNSNCNDDQLYSSKFNRSKAGLHETLKSLSAHVKQKMDEDDLRWGTTPNTSEPIYKRRIGPSISAPASNETSSSNGSSGVKPAFTIPITSTDSLNTSNTSIPTNDDSLLSPLNQHSDSSLLTLKTTSDAQRRFSQAPVASKDEQAELIRKQKAKLERHYRRSTQAVSYEDIKSAEATIKASTPTSTTAPSHLSLANISSPPPPLPSQPPPLLQPSPSTPLNNSATNNTVQSMTEVNDVNTTPTQQSQQQQAQIEKHREQPVQPIQPQQQQQQQQQKNQENSVEKDTIIAKDIETDKLLNAIEKNKGFSDSFSTTRRLRNRSNMSNGSLSYTPERDSINDDNNSNNTNNNLNNKKTKLIWNEEKLEVEVRTKEDDENNNADDLQPASQQSININNTSDFSNTNSTNFNNNNNSNGSSQVVMRRQYSTSDNRTNTFTTPLSSSPIQTNTNNNSSTTVLSPQLSTSLNISSLSQAQPQPLQHSSRQMFRFSQSNEPSTVTNTNSTSSGSGSSNGVRSNIKRSVSQVPTTDRRGISSSLTTSAINTNTTNNNNNSNSNNINITDLDLIPNRLPTTDDRQTIEVLERENETLKQAYKRVQKELEEQIKKTQLAEIGFIDKKEKRALDRKVSEMEEELKKMENVKQDNVRLKEENAALIRVISKLSK